jgi:hypothetical protein
MAAHYSAKHPQQPQPEPAVSKEAKYMANLAKRAQLP